MSPVRLVWGLILAGTAIRLVLAFATVGLAYDIESFRLVADQLDRDPLELYGALNVGETFRWPYPPAFLPLVYACSHLADWTGLPFHGLIQVPAIAADAAIAWLVGDILGRRGASERTRLAAVALVALGPSFAAVSGYHGHMDSLAILPAVAALAVWERAPGARRAVVAGLLIGLGAALKTVPGLMLIALLPSARSHRERVVLVGCALAVPVALLAPFLATDADGVRHALEYTGVPGLGGLSLVVQPDLARFWLTAPDVSPNALTRFLVDHASLVNAVVLGALAIVLLVRRAPAPAAAVATWLAVWVFGTGFFFQYVVWGLPFVIALGSLRAAAALQLALLPPMLIFYRGPWESDAIVPVFVTMMLALWCAFAAGLGVLVRDFVTGRRRVATT